MSGNIDPRLENADAFRTPDYLVEDKFEKVAVWFDPKGEKGDYATEVKWEGGGYEVSEYAYILSSLDEPTDYDRENPFSKQTVFIEEEAILEAVGNVVEDVDDLHFEDVARVAASKGVHEITHTGCTESQVQSLPDVSDMEFTSDRQSELKM